MRQTERNIERCLSSSGFIHHKHRKAFERFLKLKNPHVRGLAEEVERRDRLARALQRSEWAFDTYLEEGGSYFDIWWGEEFEPTLAEYQTARPIVQWSANDAW